MFSNNHSTDATEASQDHTLLPLPRAVPTSLPAQNTSPPRPYVNSGPIDPSLTQFQHRAMLPPQVHLRPSLPATYLPPVLTPSVQHRLSIPGSYPGPVLPHPVHHAATHQGRVARGRGNNGKKIATEHIVIQRLMAKVKTYPKKCGQCHRVMYGAIQHFEHQRAHGLRKNDVPDDGITMSAAEISALQDYYYDFYGQGPWRCAECDKVTDHFRNFLHHLESAKDPKSKIYKQHQSNKGVRNNHTVSLTTLFDLSAPAGNAENDNISTVSAA